MVVHMIEPYKLPHIAAYSRLLAESYTHWTGRELAPGRDIAEALFEAPFPIVSHGTETDPIFRYANRAALTLWEMNWEEFTKLPSRLSAEPIADIQSDRNQLITAAMQKGWVVDYTGVRISKTAKRFELLNTVLWNVVDADGHRHGQAARIGAWRYL